MEVSLDGSVCRRHQDSAVSIPITLSARLNSVRGGQAIAPRAQEDLSSQKFASR
jgi:hypothetical protein